MNDLKCREFELRDVAAAGAGLLIGAGVGAGLMYLFDPDRGKARRARLESQAGGLCRAAESRARSVGADLTHRAEGLAAEAKRLFKPGCVEPQKLEARVRAKLGRVIRKPHGVSVTANDAGKIILTGKIDAQDAPGLLSSVLRVPGVREVQNELSFHAGIALERAG